jgi:hypothetical protein
MNPYIERANEVVTPQPFSLNQSTAYTFVVKADRDALQALVDRELNAPRNPAAGDLYYRVLSRRLLLMFTRIGRLASTNPPACDHGWGREIDVAYWALLGAGSVADGQFRLERLVWFQPFIFVDNPWAMLGGREIYGFPKQLCRATMPDTPDQPGSFSAETLVLDPFAPDTELAWQQLIRIERGLPAVGGPVPPPAASGGAALLRHLLQDDEAPVIPTLHLLEALLQQLITRESSSVFLKQFRDVTQPDRACYQAVVEAPLKITRFHGFGLLPGPWQLTQYNYASQPLASALGLASPQVPSLAFWLSFDSEIKTGTTTWQAP